MSRERGPSEADDVAPLTSGLVTNALSHGKGIDDLPIKVEAGDTGALRASVTDPGNGTPQVRQTADIDSGGRGLALVKALATDFGWEQLVGGGKTVWFTLELEDPFPTGTGPRRHRSAPGPGRGSSHPTPTGGWPARGRRHRYGRSTGGRRCAARWPPRERVAGRPRAARVPAAARGRHTARVFDRREKRAFDRMRRGGEEDTADLAPAPEDLAGLRTWWTWWTWWRSS
ncbi:ATP-binding protein [Kitasatospora sp. NPDC087315]|uniref:ATP-binding protein n=1 Tax=Kitasatospora sp. NPDC087315 TaxID=3364069 RepID=UPI0038057DA0